MPAQKFRKKPVVIEAMQISGKWMENDALLVWANAEQHKQSIDAPLFVEIKTLEGTMRGDIGDWVIKGVKGEFYPCKPDIFEATYEPVHEFADEGDDIEPDPSV